ncbi:MAG: cbb3-type cytochrome c oxidase subunit 3 [Pseudomonadota bacterium]
MEYENLRQFADSWGLVYLFALFIIAILFTFKPGSRATADEAAQIPLKEDE